MLNKLIKKELSLCLHPTAFIFLAMALFVFIPNYPYEVMFFFSGLSVFFICLTARENGDLAFSCVLPISKSQVPVARILTTVIFQCALVLLASVTVTVKECVYAVDAQINYAGNTANVAFLGYGFMLLGVFDIIFFPLHFKRPDNVGIPFLIASAVIFVLIGLGIVFRWTVPFVVNVLNTPDPQYIGAKLGVLAAGAVVYAACVALSCKLSSRNFVKVDF